MEYQILKSYNGNFVSSEDIVRNVANQNKQVNHKEHFQPEVHPESARRLIIV